MKINIKPCPNCGSKKIWKCHSLTNKFYWHLECSNCHWCGSTKLFLWRAIKSWNKEKDNETETT